MIERFTDTPRRFNIARGRWGLLAPWRGHGGKRPPPIYVADRDAIARTPVLRRATPCLVHADGFYAWHKIGSKRHAFWIHGSTTFAGLVATHADDSIESFAIVVEPAPPELAAITAVVPQAVASWRAIEVSAYFSDAAHDDARCIAPLGNPNQGSLF